MLLYIIKSIITLSALYVPYMLLLRKESFFRFNRLMLLLIMACSLVLPLLDVHEWAWSYNPMTEHLRNGAIGVGNPVLAGIEEAQPAQAEDHAWLPDSGWTLATSLYALGMAVVLLMKGLQIVLLRRYIRQGVLWAEQKDGVTLYCHAGNAAPFSWMHAIVISEDDYRSNAATILQHELGHIRHHHSFDLLLLNLCQVVQWANPLAWVMGTSLRDVHEYEADDFVLRSGINATQYQNLLIKKAVGSSSYAFANGFNHSLLKKRITMMLQKKSNPWMRTKALYLIPVAAVALSAFATPVFNNAGKVTEKSADLQAQRAKTATSAVTSLPDGDEVLDICEQLPTYEGGEAGLMQFLMQSMKYPKVAMEKGVQGKLRVQFVVQKDGTCTDFKVADSDVKSTAEVVVAGYGEQQRKGTITPEEFAEGKKALEEEALRVCRQMKKWTPGKDKGQPVSVRFSLPMTFRLN